MPDSFLKMLLNILCSLYDLWKVNLAAILHVTIFPTITAFTDLSFSYILALCCKIWNLLWYFFSVLGKSFDFMESSHLILSPWKTVNGNASLCFHTRNKISFFGLKNQTQQRDVIFKFLKGNHPIRKRKVTLTTVLFIAIISTVIIAITDPSIWYTVAACCVTLELPSFTRII